MEALGPVTFGMEHFGKAQLGDQRRTKRLVKTADLIMEHPHGTLPEKLRSPAALKALYRLVANDGVTHAAVLQPHYQRTHEQMQACPHKTFLLVHDTSELDFSSLRGNLDLAPIGNGGGRGYLCHNSLAVDADSRQPLGLVSQVLFRRPKVKRGETKAQSRARRDRESRLWVQGVTQAGPVPEGCRWIDVCDRGADTFEFLDYEHRHGRQYVIRSKSARRSWLGHEEEGEEILKLHAALRALPSQGTRQVFVQGTAGRPQRTATLQVAWSPFLLQAPRQARGEHGSEPLAVWAIRVWESDPPEGAEPVEWLLLTNVPVTTFVDACCCIRYYEARWCIEDYHKGMKTGCQIEDLQFTTGQRLQAVIALLSVVTVGLLQMRDLLRRDEAQQEPARKYVPLPWIQILSAWRWHKVRDDLTVHEFLYALARLGGHQNRKSDKKPGWIILWRGLHNLLIMLEGARLGTKSGIT
jgi:Transposase DNA-binding